MCGIFGQINLDSKEIKKEEFLNSLNLINHRGPDETGFFIDKNIALGIKRLSIIDISTGDQPIENENNSMVIIYNGEIYNYIDLKYQLLKKGHIFRTKSDTEVILHLYEDYGEDCLKYLNGMFGFAIFDKNKKKLFIARDKMGIKPLFYSSKDNIFRFSSEMKAILADQNLNKDIDYSALIDYFSFYYISSPKTIYNHIKRLPPGHYITIESNNIKIEKYWNIKYNPDYNLKEDEIIASIIEKMKNSIKRHLIADVPVGIFLSSGLDSTSILAFASLFINKTKTFTVGYESQDSFSEIKNAKIVADMYNAEHYECIINEKDLIDSLPILIKQFDEPNGDWTFTGLYFISKFSKSKIKVALSGTGGDEIFGGYPTVTAAKFAKYYKKLPKFFRDNIIKKIINSIPVSNNYLSFDFKIKQFVRGNDESYEKSHMLYKEIFSYDERNILFKNKLLEVNKIEDPFNVFNYNLKDFNENNLLNRLLYLDFKVFLPEDTLYITDIATMINSQECRVPFLDEELVEFSTKIPPELKFNGINTKYIFRKAIKNILPDKILKMKKRGFTLPVSPWLRQKQLFNFAAEIINSNENKFKNNFNFNYIKNLLDEHKNGTKDHSRKIMCLISFFLWKKL